MSTRNAQRCFHLLLLLLALVLPVCGQSGNEGAIEGVVTDPSGGVVPGVTLTARNVHTGASLLTVTDETGLFRFLVVPLGTYELRAERSGFVTLVQKDVVVTVGGRVHLNLALRLAGPTEEVVVLDETPLVEPTRTQVSSIVDVRSVANLPVNGRNFIDFVLLSPGVVRGPFGGTSFGGQRSLSLMLVDGVQNNNPFFGEAFLGRPYQISLEVVREFQVNVNSYAAEFGRAGNGLISVATRSGSNDFHGSLFWYFRDRGLNATDLISKILGESKEPLHIHQFGGTFAGPVLRNRLFFFVNYDAQRRKDRNETFLDLPAGFALSSNPVVASFQQLALDYLTPRAVSWVRTFDLDVLFFRTDWHITKAQSLSVRWNRQRFTGKNSEFGSPQTSLEATGDALTSNDTLAVSLTSTLAHSTVNVLRFNYLRQDEPGRANSVNPQARIFEGGQLLLLIGRAIQNPRRHIFNQFEWSDTLSLSRGGHAYKFGVNALVSRITWMHAPSFSGNYRFNSLESFGRNLAGVPLPQTGENYIQAFSGQGQAGATLHPHSTQFAAFAQDEWRARPYLTLSLGLRYDVQWMGRPPVRNPAPALAAAGLDTSLIPTDYNNFAPRLGFAWSPLRNQRLVVRGGYGVFYVWTRASMAVRPHYQNGVGAQTRTFTGNSIPLYPNTLCGPPDPSGAPPSCPPPTTGTDAVMAFSPDYVQGYDQHGSFGVEYQLHRDLAISASYLMVKGTHLQRWRDVNLPAATPVSIGIAGTSSVLTYRRFSSPRPMAGVDRVLLVESTGSSIYHGWAVQLTKRLSHNVQFLAGYTLGKVIDDRPEALTFNPGGVAESNLLSDPSNARADRGPGVVDARHRFVMSGIWELNYGNRLRGIAKGILSGWELSGILTVQSGLPYSGLVNFDLNNDGNPFSDRTPGQPRNIFRLPTVVSLDPRVTRNVRLSERARLQFIAEAFNVFNHANISAVRTAEFSRSTSAAVCGIAGTPCLVPQASGSTAFGTPTDTTGPRILQVAIKLLF